jgi:hypothetical protein
VKQPIQTVSTIRRQKENAAPTRKFNGNFLRYTSQKHFRSKLEKKRKQPIGEQQRNELTKVSARVVERTTSSIRRLRAHTTPTLLAFVFRKKSCIIIVANFVFVFLSTGNEFNLIGSLY